MNPPKIISKNIWITLTLIILFVIGVDFGYHQLVHYFDKIEANNLHLFHIVGLSIFFILGSSTILLINRMIRLYEKCGKLKYFYETLLDNVPVPVYFKNIHGIYKYGNKAFCNQLGKEQSEILNEHARDIYENIMDDEGINEIIGDDIRVLRNLNDEAILRQIYRDGILEKYIIHKFPYKDEKENVEGIVGITYRFDTMNDIINNCKDLE